MVSLVEAALEACSSKKSRKRVSMQIERNISVSLSEKQEMRYCHKKLLIRQLLF